jgi:hypothetical protein
LVTAANQCFKATDTFRFRHSHHFAGNGRFHASEPRFAFFRVAELPIAISGGACLCLVKPPSKASAAATSVGGHLRVPHFDNRTPSCFGGRGISGRRIQAEMARILIDCAIAALLLAAPSRNYPVDTLPDGRSGHASSAESLCGMTWTA